MVYPKQITNIDGKEVVFEWMKGVDFKRYNPITQSYGIVFNKNGEVLIGRAGVQSSWNLPGGTIEGEETPLDALKRELIEEVDIEVFCASELGLLKVYGTIDKEKVFYQARYVVFDYICLEQTPDPAKNILWDRKFVAIDKISKYVKWGKTGEVMFKDAFNLWNIV